eukprot:5769175-Amphidinium_carterae.1
MTFPTAVAAPVFPVDLSDDTHSGAASSSGVPPRPAPLPPPAAPPPDGHPAAVPEPFEYGCPGCRRRLEMTHPMHTRLQESPQRC